MASLEIYAINIVANPHPRGIYEHILREASRRGARARGSDYAKLTKPADEGNGIFTGRILVWTEIDMEGKWLDVLSEKDLPPDIRRKINIPENAKPNYRTFWYCFDEHKHTFYYEARNEFSQHLGPTTARRILANLTSRDGPRGLAVDVDITIVPDEKTVGRILRSARLQRLHIRLTRPNPDDFEESKRRILRELQANHASRQDTHLIKAPGETRLTPTQPIQVLAEVAAENGFVEGVIEEDGHRVRVSTRETPRKIVLQADERESVIERMKAYVRRLRR
ncbi:DUF4747 family protein [Nitrobacter sp. TKz-YC02]|uniref:DUF4747 family protein n=1 Tax=Nitrobacter sp. TKz-YC02 TaxID=3398704 RepID=UPI003CF9F122